MYTNQIDNIVDKILDNFYLNKITQDPTINKIINEKKHNFVEYHQQINDLIKSYIDSIDTTEINKLVADKKNNQHIIDIIKRYVTYYCFLYLAYYYDGNIKEFRNNLIQFSKLQETSKFHVKNFFDTENNYQVILFFRIIKDAKNILMMTPLQQKTINVDEMSDAIKFLKDLGKEYVDSFLLRLVDNPQHKENKENKAIPQEPTVEINVHNLIKTIVFGEIYKNQERTMVFKILTEIEESENEYIYIDIVVTVEDTADFELFRNIFSGKDNAESLAQDLWELINMTEGTTVISIDTKNNHLLKFGKDMHRMVTPIVDDFLRYHRDSEKINIEHDKNLIIPIGKDNARNIRLALMKQNKNKKENTKAQLIVNKVDVISEFYSNSVKQSPGLHKEIQNFFRNSLAYRKAVLHNYLSEIYVMRKMELQGKKIMESNEYYLELKFINRNAYFNFKNFQNYGTSVVLESDTPVNVIRYANIEFNDQHASDLIDLRAIGTDDIINMSGLAFGPVIGGPPQCITRENMIDIRKVTINYFDLDDPNKKILKILKTENGYEAFLKIVKTCYIQIIRLRINPIFELYLDVNSVRETNPDIANKIIFWIYDIDKDKYELSTYENIKSYNFQDNIKYMNGKLADEINSMLYDQLKRLIKENLTLKELQMWNLIELFSSKYNLMIGTEEKKRLFVLEYLGKKRLEPSNILTIAESEREPMLVYAHKEKIIFYRIKIDMHDPTNPQTYVEPITTSNLTEKLEKSIEVKCAHEEEWNTISKLKKGDLNKYNMAITQFIYKYAVMTSNGFFICRLCSQLLRMREYVQDGKFDNATQKYTTNYVPTNIPLQEIKEYAKFGKTIKHVEGMLKKMNDMSGANMLTGDHANARIRKKTFIKNVIDITDHHNFVCSKNSFSDTFYKMYGIDKSISNIFYFEFSDKIFNFSEPGIDMQTVEINRLKLNNVLLYFLWMWISELNETQILTIAVDKIINIDSFEKHGLKLFEGLNLKKNVNGRDIVPIISYPVLCYILFVASYYLLKYGLWYNGTSKTKTFNPYNIKVIVHSMTELFNGFATKLAENSSDYIYTVIMNKLYTHLNTIYKNNSIIDMLKKMQLKASDRKPPEPKKESKESKESKIPEISKGQIIPKTRKLPTFRITTGLFFGQLDKLLYMIIPFNSNLTNCPIGESKGDFHEWIVTGTDITCSKCSTMGKDIDLDKLTDLTDLSYYFNLSKIAMDRCVKCQMRNALVGNNDKQCTTCGSNKTGYTEKELIEFDRKLNNASNAKINMFISYVNELDKEILEEEKKSVDIFNTLVKSSKKISESVGTFINKLESVLDKNINLSTEDHPLYLKDDSYVINHTYNGILLENPVIIIQKDNKIQLKENQTFFKRDVYYYTDTSAGYVDVFYDAVTLQLIGYKEKHKEYVTVPKSPYFIKIDKSIVNKFLNLGYETSYINISKLATDTGISDKSIILDTLIKSHIQTIKMIIDKISSIISRITNFQPNTSGSEIKFLSPDNKKVYYFVQKYAALLSDMKVGSTFDDWNYIRNLFFYEKINWSKTDIKFTDQMFIKSTELNYYCSACDQMIFYLIKQLIDIFDANTEKKMRTNIAMMYVELINYVYDLYNTDLLQHNHNIKRFEYVLSGTEVTIDYARKGTGLIAQEEFLESEFPDIVMDETMAEKTEDEREDAINESEALDVETPYYEESDEEDYEPTGED